MSIEATIAARFQALAEQLSAASQAIASGAPPFEVDVHGDLLRLTAARFPDDGPDLITRYARGATIRPEEAVLDMAIARVAFHILSNSGQMWEGPVSDFIALATEIEPGFSFDPSELDGRHWVGKALALAGASVYVSVDDVVRLRRRIGFGRSPLAEMPEPIEKGTRSSSRGLMLRGSWVARGLDPDTCVYCLSSPFEEVEHFIPLARGGTNDPSNLFPSCQRCNRGRAVGKFDRDPWAWLEEHHPSRLQFFEDTFRL